MEEKYCSHLKNIPVYDEDGCEIIGDSVEEILASMNSYKCKFTGESCVAYGLPEKYGDSLSPAAASAIARGESTYYDEVAKNICKAYDCSGKEHNELISSRDKIRKLEEEILEETKKLSFKIPCGRLRSKLEELKNHLINPEDL